jgi:hypothetical protein
MHALARSRVVADRRLNGRVLTLPQPERSAARAPSGPYSDRSSFAFSTWTGRLR